MYLVIGANGFLGSYILKNILEKTKDKVIAVARNIEIVTNDLRVQWLSCDISKKNDVDRLCGIMEDYSDIKIIFLAAYHNPDLVEKNPKLAWEINVTSLSYFINQIKNVKCFFYPSTDSVYGNSINGYHFKEHDRLAPVNRYGEQKCAAESAVVWYGYNVVRYPFLIAESLSPVKKHFYDVIVEHLRSGVEMEMFTDSLRSSLNFDMAASLLIELIEKYDTGIPKILNICGDNDLSKYDIGLMIAEKIGADKKLIVPISVNSSEKIYEAKRAQSTLMDNSKLKEVLNLKEILFTI